ncbi:MAG: SurA N-terminal domain-containing protein [bacterium]
MLQSIHDNAKGWVAYIIIAVISVPFALVGIGSYFGGGSEKAAAIVNGEEIPVSLVRNELQQLKQQFGQMPAFDDSALTQLTLDQLIGQKLIEQEIKEHGYRATDAMVLQALQAVPVFQKDGKFDPETYKQVLAANRRNEGQFQEEIRAELAAEQLQGLVAATSFIPQSEAELYQSLQTQQRDLESFTLKAADYKTQIQVSEAEINAYYTKNKAQFMTEERLKVDYIEVNREAIAAAITLTEDEIGAYFEQNKDRYIVPEKRYASHIVIAPEGASLDAPASPEKEQAAKAKAEALYQAIKSGQRTFEDVAKTDSADRLSAEKGGDLGVIVAGDWGKVFEDKVYALALNAVSEPVKTASGYELIKVTKIEPKIQKTLAEAKADVEKDMRNTQADDTFQNKDDELPTLAYENENDLAPVASALDLEKKTSAWITRNQGEGIGQYPQVRELAFGELKSSQKNSERIDLAEGHTAVFRVVEVQAPTQKPLAEVKASIQQRIESDKLQKLVQTKGDALLATLKTTQNWSALTAQGLLAQGVGADTAVEKLGFINRQSQALSFDMLSQAFAMPKPATGRIEYLGSLVQGGDYQVIALKAVKEGEKKLTNTTRQAFDLYLSNRQTVMLLQSLRDEAEVEIHPENI